MPRLPNSEEKIRISYDDKNDEYDEEKYIKAAEKMLHSLSSATYQSRKHNSAFLLHSTGNLPAGYEVDSSINYADYYYIEALTRYRNLFTTDKNEKNSTDRCYSFTYIGR